jgi:hypothetical protein
MKIPFRKRAVGLETQQSAKVAWFTESIECTSMVCADLNGYDILIGQPRESNQSERLLAARIGVNHHTLHHWVTSDARHQSCFSDTLQVACSHVLD